MKNEEITPKCRCKRDAIWEIRPLDDEPIYLCRKCGIESITEVIVIHWLAWKIGKRVIYKGHSKKVAERRLRNLSKKGYRCI
jgi:hypothetical protein